MANFCKNGDCPTSAELLEFEIGELPGDKRIEIRSHLAGCEFCTAEIEFYSRYPQFADDDAGEPERVDIPAPLFELAEALLKHSSDKSALDVLLRNEELASR